MLGKRALGFVVLTTWVLFLCVAIYPQKAYSVPAAPVIHTLKQLDGGTFKARQWGDENHHGWETKDGYTILFDKTLNRWVYAVRDANGRLSISSRIAGKDRPPAVQRHIRPLTAHQPLKKKLTREAKVLSLKRSLEKMPQKVVQPARTGKIPVILINFYDTITSISPFDFNTLLFGTGSYSMKDYYEEVSYRQFTISSGNAGIMGWYTASSSHDYYGDNDDVWGIDMYPGTLVREAVATADASVNFSEYDQDGDCYVDVVSIIHQGEGEEASGNPTDIWSHRWDLNSAYAGGYSDGGEYETNDTCFSNPSKKVKVNDYIIQPEILWGNLVTIGVFAHEYGHSLGLPDLYDTDYSSEGIGVWSLMAFGTWNGTLDGDRPAHLDAWSKYFLGWVNPVEVAGTLNSEQIQQVEASSDIHKLGNGSPLSGEYFLVENRQLTGFDEGLPGSGLLIWHIDGDTINANMAPNSVNDNECYPGGPSCANQHYGVALVQADNLWELEEGGNAGNAGDPYQGTSNNTSFTNISSPDSKFYNGNPSGVSITNISPSSPVMTADLSFL